MSSISFGVWSTSLLLGSAHGVIGAGLLLWAPRNRIANRCLAALLLVVVALITPIRSATPVPTMSIPT